VTVDLGKRRNRANLIEVFKMIKRLSATPWSSFLHVAAESSTRGHSWKFVKKSCWKDTRLYFYSQRVVNKWNSLSQAEVDAPSINSFKNHREKKHTADGLLQRHNYGAAQAQPMFTLQIAAEWVRR